MQTRHFMRKKGFDYGVGVFHVTICTKDRMHLFGAVENGVMILNKMGRMIDQQWRDLPKRFPGIELDEFVIMPNHLHGIMIVGAGLDPAPSETESGVKQAGARPAPTVSSVIGAFKSITVFECRKSGFKMQNFTIWQRSFYDQIIDNLVSLDRIREYIQKNPVNWAKDPMFIP